MKKISIAFFFCIIAASTQAQTSKELHETAKAFTKQGDHANAVLVLNRALMQEPQNRRSTLRIPLT
ncbi:MAG: hypothetical protein EOO03_11250 [Chitinophagaceae bacterium]|nr:MAG: hypothetical protein EOO03_11250 [Chitinophagaceae bacterium]